MDATEVQAIYSLGNWNLMILDKNVMSSNFAFFFCQGYMIYLKWHLFSRV